MFESALSSPAAFAISAIWISLVTFGAARLARRVARPVTTADGDDVKRVVRNSAIPIVSQMLVRAVDLLVAIALLRLLGPEGNGRYAVAVVVWLYAKTISDFGLSVLATRDIARDPALASHVVGTTTILRWLVQAVTIVPVGAYLVAGHATGSLSGESVLAIGLLFLSIVPSSYGEAVNAALNGLERMDVAAWLNVAVSLARAPLAVVLGAAWGVGGVAIAGLLGATLSAFLFGLVSRATIARGPRWTVELDVLRRLAGESWPLLVNALLVSLFFRVDIFIVQAARGDAALGVYDAAYKLINLLIIVPAYATLAVFPLLSRRATDPVALGRAAGATIYLLVSLAFGIVVGVTALAGVAIHVLAGPSFLPEAAVLLRILIWFAPLSFANGVIQYVLVASGRQRRLVPAFCTAVAFNVLANVAFVPAYGARAAATNTVLTELVISVSFVLLAPDIVRELIGRTLVRRIWRPCVAGLGATVIAFALRDQPAVALGGGIVALCALGWATRVVGATERELVRRLLPARLAPKLAGD